MVGFRESEIWVRKRRRKKGREKSNVVKKIVMKTD